MRKVSSVVDLQETQDQEGVLSLKGLQDRYVEEASNECDRVVSIDAVERVS